jgi:chemotaxis protein MotB
MNPRVPRQRVSQDRWLVSYADFITLLFGLFVVMYAFARADQKKQVEVSQSIDTAFRSLGLFPSAARKAACADGGACSGKMASSSDAKGSDQPEIPMNIVMGEDVMAPAEVKRNLEHLRTELTQALSNQVATHTVAIRMGKDGLVISLREAGFFASGSAMPKPETVETLSKIAVSLSRTPYDLRIEGHTDNVPIHTASFDSNWELSTTRATHIARMLIEMHAIDAAKISAAGYAEFHPVADNGTDQGRAQNRRVDIVVLPRSRIDFANGAQGTAASGSEGGWRKITDDD